MELSLLLLPLLKLNRIFFSLFSLLISYNFIVKKTIQLEVYRRYGTKFQWMQLPWQFLRKGLAFMKKNRPKKQRQRFILAKDLVSYKERGGKGRATFQIELR